MPKSPEISNKEGNDQESFEQLLSDIQDRLQEKYPDQEDDFTKEQYPPELIRYIKNAIEEKNQEILNKVIKFIKEMLNTPLLSGAKNYGWRTALAELDDYDYSTDNGWNKAREKIEQLIGEHEEKEEKIKEHIEEIRSGIDKSIEEAKEKGKTAIEDLLMSADMSMGNYIDEWTLMHQPVEESVDIFLNYVPDLLKLIKLQNEAGFNIISSEHIITYGKPLIERVEESDMSAKKKEKFIAQIRSVIDGVVDEHATQ